MSTGLLERPAPAGAPGHGGVPARRAVIRWAWRLLRREWRQQLLVLGLVTVAVAATIVGAAVATDTPPAANAGFGTAQDQATFQAPDPHLASQIAALRHRFGRVDVIENQTIAIPGSIDTYDLRAQNPHGPYGQPMLSLVSGHYPAGPGQVAVTSGVAATFHLTVGDLWRQDGTARRVTGIVREPAEPGGRVRPRGPGPGHRADAGHCPVRRARRAPAQHRAERVHAALGVVGQRAEPADHRARPGHRRHAAHRPGGDRRLHGARAAPAAVPGAAGRPGGHRQEHPSRRPGQRRAGGHPRRGGRVRAGPGRLAGLPADRRDGFPSPDRRLPAAVDRDRRGHGPRRHRHLFRRLPAGPVGHQDPGRDRPVRAARAAQADPPLGAARPDPARRGRGPVRLLRHDQRQRPRSTRTRPRLRRADRGGDPAGPGVPHAAGQAGPPGPDRGPAGPARPGPVPGQVRLGARRHHARRADRRAGQRAVRAALRQRPRLRRAQPGVGSDHRLHAQRAGRRRAG